MQQSAAPFLQLRIVLIGFAAFAGLIFAFGFIAPPALSWGFHWLHYLPSPAALVVFGAIGVAAVYCAASSRWTAIDRLGNVYDRFPWRTTGLLAILFIGGAFLFRVGAPLLGDSFYIIRHYSRVAGGENTLSARNEPLPVFLFYAIMKFIGQPGYHELLDAFFYGELVLGCIFIAITSVLVRVLFRGTFRVTALFMLVCMPYVQLLFGYVENYSLALILVAAYTLAGVHVIRGSGSFILACLIAILMVLTHYLMLLLAPSLLILGRQAYRQGRIAELAIGAGSIAAAIAVLLAAVHGNIAIILPPPEAHHYLSAQTPVAYNEAMTQAYTIVSRYHLADLFNYWFLMAAGGTLLFLGGLALKPIPAVTENRNDLLFLTVAFVPMAVFIIAAKFDLGAARDWDVCAPYFFLFAAAGLVFLAGRTDEHRQATRIAVLATVLTLVTTGTMVAVNASPAAGVARYSALFDMRNMSRVAWYNGHLTLARYFRFEGKTDSAIDVWTRYSQLFPGDARGYQNILSNLARRPGADVSEVARVYDRWIAARPNDDDARRAYAAALVDAGNASFQSDRLDEAAQQYRRAFEVDSLNAQAVNNTGSVLAQQGRPALAIPYFQRAITISPGFADAYLNLGMAYADIGNKVDGRRSLQQAAALGNVTAQEMLSNPSGRLKP